MEIAGIGAQPVAEVTDGLVDGDDVGAQRPSLQSRSVEPQPWPLSLLDTIDLDPRVPVEDLVADLERESDSLLHHPVAGRTSVGSRSERPLTRAATDWQIGVIRLIDVPKSGDCGLCLFRERIRCCRVVREAVPSGSPCRADASGDVVPGGADGPAQLNSP
jgi:hypothetical protein